jgi:hypothetical protein
VAGRAVAGNARPGCGGGWQFGYRHLITFKLIGTSTGTVFVDGLITKEITQINIQIQNIRKKKLLQI